MAVNQHTLLPEHKLHPKQLYIVLLLYFTLHELAVRYFHTFSVLHTLAIKINKDSQELNVFKYSELMEAKMLVLIYNMKLEQ